MKILILSDNHSRRIDDFDFLKYDYIIHCGDYGDSLDIINTNNIIYVKGNCDSYGDKEVLVDINDKKYLITHGDLYGVKYDYLRLELKALSSNADIILFGHTHRQTYFKDKGKIFINPGSYQEDEYVEIEDNKIKLMVGKTLKKLYVM